MGKRKKKSSKKIYGIICSLIILLLICLGAGVSNVNEAFNAVADAVGAVGNSVVGTWQDENESKEVKAAKTVTGTLEMHTIDVGQGDSCLIMQGTNTMLIDCGTKAKGKDVVAYLKNLGIKKIDVLIGTHPHDDHMGGMAEVINNFEIGVLYTPDNSNDNITTNWYMELLNAIDEKNIEWKYAKARR